MIELSQHIEVLLLENECVIVPGLGGFIAHYTTASWDEQESLFLPPMRTIGFNPQLQLNDGILVQSYMNTYDTNFSDASKRIQQAVDKLSAQLYEAGKTELPNIGEIRYTIRQTYEFAPFNHKLATPPLYGFDSFKMHTLQELEELQETAEKRQPATLPAAAARQPEERRIGFSYWTGIAAMIAIIATCFFISTPVENTSIEKNNYANLVPMDIFENIVNRSAVTTRPAAAKAPVTKVAATAAVATAAPAAPTTAKATVPEAAATAVQPAAVTAAQPARGMYHIIVSSGIPRTNAINYINELKNEGHAEARLLECEGKNRVSILSFASEAEATRQLFKLREAGFPDAWLFANK